MNQRIGEKGALPERRERFFQRQAYWYYSTREGVDIGPYDSKGGAVKGCEQFIEYLHKHDPGFANTLELYSSRAA